LPNYVHVPIGYHGRASSIRLSGERVIRPQGQKKKPDSDSPVFGPSERLDYEFELGAVIGAGNALGSPIPIAEAEQHILGYVLLNDWSARDIQAWEYQPLGPFLSKSFCSTISPWVVMREALEPYRCAQFARGEKYAAPLPYLSWDGDYGYDISFSIAIQSEQMRATNMPHAVIAQSTTKHLFWTFQQLVTHHASNGCNLLPGDLLGSGTISGPTESECGALIETTHGGKTPITLPSGETRTFLCDGDEVLFRAYTTTPGLTRIGFGECRGLVLATN
jgi:fumarylacetoacetase